VTPKVSHLNVVKRIFRYLKGQPKLGLLYPRDSPFDLEAFSNSDYARASLDRKSTTGGIRSARPRTTSVMIRNVEEEPKRATPVPTVQSQDKGKGKMVEPEPTLKNPRKAQI
ncbi:hypothetical protein Tco_0254484, partial [Tanacetum coccineum]